MSLASRLPYDHPYAGGYPGIGSQPLPTDADALDYLSRMATADGAGVEAGVAVALDAFITALKADSLWDDIGSSCLLCGPRTLAGALVPLRGPAPTAEGGWASGDYDRSTGPNASSSGSLYLDTNLSAGDIADIDSSGHVAVFRGAGSLPNDSPIGVRTTPFSFFGIDSRGDTRHQAYIGSGSVPAVTGSESDYADARALVATRQSSTNLKLFGPLGQIASNTTESSSTPSTETLYVFGRNENGSQAAHFSGSIAFYSVGEGITDSQATSFVSHITDYVTAIGAAI